MEMDLEPPEIDQRWVTRLVDFAPRFLNDYAAINNKVSEVETKERHLRAHLLPVFGKLPLEEIDNARIAAFIRLAVAAVSWPD